MPWRSLGGDWTGPLERALEIAVAEGLQEQAGRAFANLHVLYCGELRFTEAEPYFAEGVAYCDEHDIGTFGICLRGEHTQHAGDAGPVGRGGRAEPASC